LLPAVMLLRRMDLVAVIGEALTVIYVEGRRRREVAAAAGAPLATVRGWRRRFQERAEEVRLHFTALAHRWDPELGGIEPRGSVMTDALEAMGMAAAAWVRRFGPEPLWSLVAAASAGRLLSNTSYPLPSPG